MLLNQASLAELSAALETRFNQGLSRSVTPFDFMAMDVPSVASENVYPFLVDMGSIREWIGDRQVQNLTAGSMRLKNRTWEETHGVSVEAIEDDQVGLYGPMFEQVGANVAALPSEQLFGLLARGFTTIAGDGQYFFDDDHQVGAVSVSNTMGGTGEPWFVIDGSKVYKPLIRQKRRPFKLIKLFDDKSPNVFFQRQLIFGVDGREAYGYSPFWQLAFASRMTLDKTNLAATLVAMASQRGPTGRPLKVTGTHLVVGTALSEAARHLVGQDTLAGGESNTMHGRLKLIVAPELDQLLG